MLRHRIIAFMFLALMAIAGCGRKTSTPEPEEASGDSEPVRSTEDDYVTKKDDFAPLQPLELSQPSLPQPDTSPADEVPIAEPRAAAPVALRISDNRPDINEARLEASGIRMLQSKRLVLLTDLPEQQVAGLPELADKLFDHLEQHFGELPEAADGSQFQVTGCIISERARFQSTGLMPEPEFGFKYGRHREYQFWMMAPNTDYYRRHLMLHEFTHCFMTCETTMLDIPPRWYVEGMAEFFATHRLADDGTAEFGILPESIAGYEGWGRVAEMSRLFERSQTAKNEPEFCRIEPVAEVLKDVVWSEAESDYARWWAISWLLQSNPSYRQVVEPLKSLRRRDEFLAAEQVIRKQLGHRLNVDWLLVAESLEPGFDLSRSFPIHAEESGKALSPSSSIEILAEKDWQDTGFRLAAGDSVVVTCEGRYSMNTPSEQWVSEPQGISVEYVRGFPIGRVVATLVSSDGQAVTHRFSIGQKATVHATEDAELWMQVNDSSANRSDNSGGVKVAIFPQ